MQNQQIKHIAFIGSGNTAHVLANLFFNNGVIIDKISSRNKQTGELLANSVNAKFTDDFNFLSTTQLIIICTPDSAIENIVSQMPNTNTLVCHCAGSVPITVLQKFAHHGVLYPLQTLSKNIDNNILNIPFLLETNSTESENKLSNLITLTENKFKIASSETRLQYHLAAVFANNFSNAMFVAAQQITEKNNLDFELLQPLIHQTVNKLNNNLPANTQTGPAIRNDIQTMNKHLELLTNMPNLKTIYKIISEFIASNKK